MKYFIPLLVAICCPIFVFCQDITGLWKGSMFNDSTQQFLDYEIVISKEKGKLTGYSYTSFTLDNQKHYGVKKMNIRVAKDGKIIMQDMKIVENNYPGGPNKNMIQLNVLNLANSGAETFLDGRFVTNRYKDHQAFTGRLSIKRVDASSQSDLMLYLQKNNEDFAVAK